MQYIYTLAIYLHTQRAKLPAASQPSTPSIRNYYKLKEPTEPLLPHLTQGSGKILHLLPINYTKTFLACSARMGSTHNSNGLHLN